MEPQRTCVFCAKKVLSHDAPDLSIIDDWLRAQVTNAVRLSVLDGRRYVVQFDAEPKTVQLVAEKGKEPFPIRTFSATVQLYEDEQC